MSKAKNQAEPKYATRLAIMGVAGMLVCTLSGASLYALALLAERIS